MKFTLIAVIISTTAILFSCANKSREKLIVGKWKMNDRIITFDQNGKIIRKSLSYNDEKISTYKLTNNEEYIVSQDKGYDKSDTIKIIELTDKNLVIETPDKERITLTRVQ
jgi:uncharacterized protein (TIGR03066 family)